MSTDPIDKPHPTFDNPLSSHEQAVEEARQLTERLSYLLRVIANGGPISSS